MALSRVVLALAVVTVCATMIGSASAATTACKAATAADNKCEASLKKDDVFTMDCTPSSDTFNPNGLNSALDAKVCMTTTKWTKADTTCSGDNETGGLALLAKGIAVTYLQNTLTITNKAASGSYTLNGSCLNTAKDKSSYFNVTVSSAYSGLNATVSIMMAMIATGMLSAGSLL